MTMIRKFVLPIACVVGILQSGLIFDEKKVSKTVINAIHKVDAINITTTKLERDERNASKIHLAEASSTAVASDAVKADLSSDSTLTTNAAAAADADVWTRTHGKIYKSPLTMEQKLERERIYYDHHFQQISTLVNMSTLLDWNRDRQSRGKYKPWLDNFDFHKLRGGDDLANITKIFYRSDGSLCSSAKMFHNYRTHNPNTPKPHILLARLNQDFGVLSSRIKGKTGRFKSLPHDWIKAGCTVEFIMDYINHPDTLAIFTIQFQKWSVPKVISIPLGLASGGHSTLMNQMKVYTPGRNRTQLLMVNSRGWAGRAVAIRKIKENFKDYGVPQNTYNNYTYTACPYENVKSCYYWELSQTKFVLSPSGLGVDCYRNWESIYVGAIPVLERLSKTDGWFENTLADLPIAWVDDYKDLTPEYLEKEYERIVLRTPPTAYKFEKMTRQYWIHMLDSIVVNHYNNLAENGFKWEAAEAHLERVKGRRRELDVGSQPDEEVEPEDEAELDEEEEAEPDVDEEAGSEEEEATEPEEEVEPDNADEADRADEDEPEADKEAELQDVKEERDDTMDTGEEHEESDEDEKEGHNDSEDSAEEEEELPEVEDTNVVSTHVANWDASLRDAEKEEIYYNHHFQQMSTLVNMSSLMDWNRDRRKRGKYRPWLDNFDFHKLSKSSTEDISNVDKVFFRSERPLCTVAKIFHNHWQKHPDKPKPHILLARLNQDFGVLSSTIKGKTGSFKKLPADWIRYGCTEKFVMDYINHPDTLAIFTNQFQKWNIPKVISLPLGLHAGGQQTLINLMRRYSPAKDRTQLLMVNSKPWSNRRVAINAISKNFRNYKDGVPQNTYNNYDNTACPYKQNHIKACYYWEMSQSKFVLSPSGLGVDCYRNWEAIYMGAIPVLERLSQTDGWFENTLADLPIAWIDDYKNLTPEYLEEQYDRLVHKTPPTAYKFEKMTRQYWIRMAYSILEEHKQKVEQQSTSVVAETARRLLRQLNADEIFT